MKTNLVAQLFCFCLLPSAFCLSSQAQGTAFTYQGRLNDAGSPAHGTYDFRFKLFQDSFGNTQAGSTLLINGVSMTNGLFTVTIDFGTGIFNGSNYWLEVDLRTNGGGGYANLNPLQAVTPSPYAIFANTASNLSGTISSANVSGVYSGAVTLNNGANSFSGAFNGNGSNVTNVNAVALGGLGANQFWKITGNSNTVAGVSFVGTADNQPLEIRVNGLRAFRIEPSVNANSAPNMIGGAAANFVTPGIDVATIGGGNFNGIRSYFGTVGGGAYNTIGTNSASSTISGGYNNTISDNSFDIAIGGGSYNSVGTNSPYAKIGGGRLNSIANSATSSTICGGYNNTIQQYAAYSSVGGGWFNGIMVNAFQATIGGGYNNNISAGLSTIAGGTGNSVGSFSSTIGGGSQNTIGALSPYGTVAGGANNLSSAFYATVGGGTSNQVYGYASTVPGGSMNTAAGSFSFAGGHEAYAAHDGSFVWADSQSATFPSTSDNQFSVRATGGARFVTGGAGMTLDGPEVITGGNVGIGTTSPQAPLHVSASGEAIRLQGQFPGFNNSVYLSFFNGAGTALGYIGDGSSSDDNLYVTSYNGSVVLYTPVGAALTASALGRVGIGTSTPGFTLEVNGSAHRVDNSANWTIVSDRRLKRDVARLTNGLATVERLNPVRFQYTAEYSRENPDCSDKERFGVVAQEFREVFPDYVTEDKDGLLSVDISPVTIYNTAAIQELNRKLEVQRAENAQLKQRLAALEKIIHTEKPN